MNKKNFFLKEKTFYLKNKIFNSNRTFITNTIWFFVLKKNNKIIGIGECNPLLDTFKDSNQFKFKEELDKVYKKVISLKKTKICYYHKYISYPSILFGLEQVLLSLKNKFPVLYNSKFVNGKEGVPVNGLIWLNSFNKKKENNVMKYIGDKIMEGFSFIKIKINTKLFNYQYFILKKIKKKYPIAKIRIDANGCFNNVKDTLFYLNKLYELNMVCSIEQPILSGNWKYMSEICKQSKIPIALDEELKGINNLENKKRLLDFIKPKYIVIKPSINGGFFGSKEWILEAKKREIKWWISSSLESNIGINAIAQWTFIIDKKYKNKINVHGLNTGFLYINNWESPLEIKKGSIWYNPLLKWKIKI
ncbi:enolase C-terminal domain-like protein [Blattabacterium cuenoti]|uniref:enolase C-terminal domain-like protein n=1 Tax=Blattabacterium cuenoti TaxID=1653831 RepID=UPI00163B6F8A|nr:enolase C-terminal domain-like protein [Blattabacterium cuenoti]